MKKTKEEIEDEMEEGELDETVYDAEGREKLREDEEIEDWEEGFMEGAEDDGEQGKCANCGGALLDEDLIETEINNKVMWFCSEDCLEEYKRKKKRKL
jgi:hypothetical protein